MAMRVNKSARRGVSGDCQRHRSHHFMQTKVFNKPAPLHIAMRGTLPQSREPEFVPYVVGNTAIKIQPVIHESIRTEVKEHITPTVKLATDGGRTVKGDDEYQTWLREFAWTPKARAKSVVMLLQPGDRFTVSHVVEYRPVTIAGIPIGNLKQQWRLTERVPVSWQHVKQQHLERAANSRREANNNVSRAVVRATLSQSAARILTPKPEESLPPWDVAVAANDTAPAVSTDTAVHAPLPEQMEGGFMEQVSLIRQTRAYTAQAVHYRSSGFMDDVADKRVAAAQYYERYKYVFGSGRNTEAGISDNSKAHSAAMYMQRRAWHKHIKEGTAQIKTELVPRTMLPDARKNDSTRIAATSDEQVSVHQQLFDAFHPPHLNREFWNGPTPQPEPKAYAFPSTEELISRAKQRIAAEDKAMEDERVAHAVNEAGGLESMRLKSWLRGHANRTYAQFDKMMRLTVVNKLSTRSTSVTNLGKMEQARYDLWMQAHGYRKFSIMESVLKYTVHIRLTAAPPVKRGLMEQCSRLFSKLSQANERGELGDKVLEIIKGVYLPAVGVTTLRPAMAMPRGSTA